MKLAVGIERSTSGERAGMVHHPGSFANGRRWTNYQSKPLIPSFGQKPEILAQQANRSGP